MTSTGVMVTENQEAEPIIPCSWLDKLGYKIVWGDGKVLVDHPERKSLKVHLDDGCPQIARSEAMKLLREFEEKFPMEKLLRRLEMKCDDEVQKEVGWMHELLEVHPVLKGLPRHVKESLVVAPGSWSDLPANRHARKKLRGGFLCHLYAGPKEGFTLKKALAELNHGAKILEVDILRGADHDVSGPSSKAYKGLLRAALDGELHGLVSGPNCRTRSILRFHEVLGGPRPVRGWNGEEWGLNDLSPDEQQQVEMDDVLMWRMIFLAIVAKYGLAVASPLKVFRFAVEQPMEPHYEPRCVSFWLTPEWLALKEMYGWEEQGFNQGDYAEGPVPVKPTKFGGNLKLRLPEKLNPEARGRSHSASVKSSKDLARWCPGLMRAVAEACVRDVFEVENPRISQLTWKQHCEAGHVPLRRDCRVCQESSAKARPHRSVRHPLVATLSVDTAGPLAMGRDVEQDARYFLCGTFTWLKPLPEKPEKPKEDAGEELVEEDEKEEEGLEDLEAGEESEEEESLQRGEVVADEIDGVEVKEEERLEPEIEVFKFATPIPSKAECNILEVLNLWHIQLRVHGYEIRRLHSDRGGEFFGRGVQKWATARGILRTSTARDTKANGRAEKAIQEVKARIRRALHGASMPLTDWPLACRYVHEHEKMKMMDRFQLVPPFGQEILVRKRYWKTKELEASEFVTLLRCLRVMVISFFVLMIPWLSFPMSSERLRIRQSVMKLGWAS